MKKNLLILFAFLLISSLSLFATSAEENGSNYDYVNNLPAPESDIHIRVAGLNKNGELVLIEDNQKLYNGWNTAMEHASPSKLKENGYVSIVVDIYFDWKGGSHGVFCDYGVGFDWDTIYVPEDSTVIINLNGHTIDRELTEWENNGEVIAIDENATVIINGGCSSSDKTEGTITGGYSAQFGGGIHIKEGANVILNNVNVVGNRVEDASGAGISVAKNATLTMNGGSVSNNKLAWTYSLLFVNMENYGIGVYGSSRSTLIFNDVDFKNNIEEGGNYTVDGAAIYTRSNADLTVNNCYFEGNGLDTEKGMSAKSTISTDVNCDVVIKDSVFKKNGWFYYDDAATATGNATHLIDLNGNILIDGCTFEENTVGSIASFHNSSVTLKDSTFTNNTAINLFTYWYAPKMNPSVVSGCTFKDNIQKNSVGNYNYSFYITGMKDKSKLTFTADNVFGDEITFKDKDKITFLTDENDQVGSIFGKGSIAIIVSIAALCISAGTVIIFYMDKKKNKEHPTEPVSSLPDQE